VLIFIYALKRSWARGRAQRSPSPTSRFADARADPQPDPAKKLVVHLTGTIASYITFCWSGPILDNIK
jgi:hypothetical protein